MRRLVLMTCLGASCVVLNAEFVYQETSQMTGGSMLAMLKMAGPFASKAREPNVSTHMLKGDRMVTLSKDRASVIDLGKETITEIDFAKKTYSVMTFAEMKQAMENAMQRAQKQPAGDSKVDADLKVSAKATGQTKIVQGLEAKELVVTMAIEGTDKASGQSGSMTTDMDSWVAPVPGYDEVRAFHKKMGEKMGYLFGSGMSQMAMMRPDMANGFAQAGREMAKLDGMPVQTVLKMSGAATGDAATPAADAPASASPSRMPTSLGGLAGALARRKAQQSSSQQAQQDSASPGSLIEMTTELTSFSSGPVDESKFEVPAGFKQVDSEMRRRNR
jgi:hypothetical protein